MKHEKHIGIVGTLIITTVLVLFSWLQAGHAVGSPRLIVWFFDVGQGDAIFIESPTGHQVLIDGGGNNAVLEKLSAVMPFWDRSIDDVINTHPHADHLDGLVDVVDRYAVSRVYQTGIEYYTPLRPEFNQRTSDGEELIDVLQPTDLDLGGGVVLRIIYPTSSFVGQKVDDPNQTSIVALLTYGDTSVLLTGDTTAENEPELQSLLTDPVDVLKVAHHGSAYSSTMPFLQTIHPRYAIISCGVNNDYGHPAPSTLERLRAIGAQTFRTDLQGDIRLISDGGEPQLLAIPL